MLYLLCGQLSLLLQLQLLVLLPLLDEDGLDEEEVSVLWVVAVVVEGGFDLLEVFVEVASVVVVVASVVAVVVEGGFDLLVATLVIGTAEDEEE